MHLNGGRLREASYSEPWRCSAYSVTCNAAAFASSHASCDDSFLETSPSEMNTRILGVELGGSRSSSARKPANRVARLLSGVSGNLLRRRLDLTVANDDLRVPHPLIGCGEAALALVDALDGELVLALERQRVRDADVSEADDCRRIAVGLGKEALDQTMVGGEVDLRAAGNARQRDPIRGVETARRTGWPPP